MNNKKHKLSQERILVIGGTGSLGKALIRRLSDENELHIMSRDEAKHWTIKNGLSPNSKVIFHVGDVRDYNRVLKVLLASNPTIVIIASALKQVETCERSPYESVQTNLIGVQNVCEAISLHNYKLESLRTVLLVSTDKACAPTNVYGMCKAVSERIVTTSLTNSNKIKFVAVRYGNVLESRGSIIPLFRYQIEVGKALTVTHEKMTRFSMTLDQSIDLIEKTILNASNGEIWVPKIPAMRIFDLAEIFAKKYKSKIIITGIRPGEKLHEDLVSGPESIRTRESEFNYIIESATNQSQFSGEFYSYNSTVGLMSKLELENYLDKIGIFSLNLDQFIGRDIEEIRHI